MGCRGAAAGDVAVLQAEAVEGMAVVAGMSVVP
jgi:hypothetical protein